MQIEKTGRGFSVSKFRDRYSSQCSIQDSSIATEYCIWLGVDVDFDGNACTRMHLTQSQVKELLPLLENFVKTGSIGD